MTQPFATLLMTRPRSASEEFAARGDWAGVRVVITPLLEIVPTGQVPDLEDVRGVIFTSANGVLHAGTGARRPAFCVGSRTTEAANAAGWPARQAGLTADALVKALTREKVASPLLHIGGVHRRGAVARRLTEAGIPTREVDVYDQQSQDLNESAMAALMGNHPVIVPLFSPRTARQFAKCWSGSAPLHLVAISDAVMREVAAVPALSRAVAAQPDSAGVKRTLDNLLQRVEAEDAAS